MKRQFFSAAVAGLFMVSGMLTSRAQVSTQPVTNTFPSAAGVTFLPGNVPQDCSNAITILMTGPTTVRRLPSTFGGNGPTTIPTEMLSLDLSGGGMQLMGMGTGAVTGGPTKTNFFPAESFFDVFIALHTGSDVLTNQQPIRVQTHIIKIPPISSTYTNINPCLLFSAQSGQPVGTLIQVWHHPSQQGKETKCAVSLDVLNGFMTPGLAKLTVCSNTTGTASAVYDIKRQQLVGPVTINGCDDCGYPCNLTFVATWASNIRAPDWRGIHKGTWQLLCGTNVYAKGAMSGLNGVGTHRPPLKAACELCNECSHFEGELIGNVYNINTGLKIGKIQAVYAGDFLDAALNPIPCCPLPTKPPNGPFNMTIEGIEILPCP